MVPCVSSGSFLDVQLRCICKWMGNETAEDASRVNLWRENSGEEDMADEPVMKLDVDFNMPMTIAEGNVADPAVDPGRSRHNLVGPPPLLIDKPQISARGGAVTVALGDITPKSIFKERQSCSRQSSSSSSEVDTPESLDSPDSIDTVNYYDSDPNVLDSPIRRDRKHRRLSLRVCETMGTLHSAALQLMVNNPGELGAFYEVGPIKLGEGTYGVVYRAKVLATGALRAVKSVRLAQMKESLPVLKREIHLMKTVDHPNLIMLHEIFEDDDNMHLVMELCKGGDLQARVKREGRFKERQAAPVILQILRGTAYMHSVNICHRDIKAKNCLLATSEPVESNLVKLSDLGLSCFCKAKDVLTSRAGTLTHMAPEMLAERYGRSCDVWSCGVVLYHILSGRLPFGNSEEEVKNAYYSFGFNEWIDVSREAIDLVSNMLSPSARRLSAKKALRHAWFKTFKASKLARQKVKITKDLVENMRLFRSFSKFRRAALSVVASMLSEEQIGISRDLFLTLDANGDGLVSVKELQKVLSKREELCNEVDVRSVFRFGTGLGSSDHRGPGEGRRACKTTSAAPAAADMFASLTAPKADGEIGQGKAPSVSAQRTAPAQAKGITEEAEEEAKEFTYIEFLAATFDREICLQEKVCRAAFNSFDKNGDGKISMSELASGRLLGQFSIDDLGQTLEELDLNNDCYIDFAEFTTMMRSTEASKSSFRFYESHHSSTLVH